MKKAKFFVFSLLLTSSLLSFVHAQVDFQKGRVNMNGEILESACTIDLDSLNQTIDITDLPISSIRNHSENISKEFVIRLIDCRWGSETQNNLKNISISFTGQSEGEYFKVDGDARGVFLALESSLGTRIIPNETVNFYNSFSRENVEKYRFKLLADGMPLKTGFFKTIIHFNIRYQ